MNKKTGEKMEKLKYFTIDLEQFLEESR